MGKLAFLERVEEYPRVTRKLQLGNYNREFKGDFLEVWVNWSREFNDRVVDWQARLARAQQMEPGTNREAEIEDVVQEGFGLNAEYWGCSVEEVEAIWNVDVDLWTWVLEEANRLRDLYRDQRKKGG